MKLVQNVKKEIPKLENFLEALSGFQSKEKPTKKWQSHSQIAIINNAVEACLHLPNVEAVSFFKLQDKTYNIKHKQSNPVSYKANHSELLEELIEEGIIGNILNAPQVLAYPEFEDSQMQLSRIILLPIIGKSTVLGIVIISFKYLTTPLYSNLKNLLPLIANLIAVELENSYLHTNLEHTKELLEQKVALKTMNLAQSKRELNAIFDSVHSGVLVIDASHGAVVKANPAAIELIGDNNLVGMNYKNYLDFTHPHTPSIVGEKFAVIKNFESALKKADDKIIPIMRTISFLTVGNNHYRIESFFDISDRKESEEKLKNINKELEAKVKERTQDLQLLIKELTKEVSEREKVEKQLVAALEKEKELNEMKTKFVSMISHEFKTPLTVIRSSAQLMERFGDKLSPKDYKEYLSKIQKTVDSMKDMIDNVIFIGKKDSDSIELSRTSINLSELCNNVINDIKIIAGNKRDISYSASGSQTINTDSRLLRHILTNLLSNAVKYSPEDKPIELNVQASTKKTIISVRDYGIGIPEKEQKRIFDIFYRGKNVGAISGTGLGMSVILKSVELLNGKLDVSSVVNEGSTFKVTIPNIMNNY